MKLIYANIFWFIILVIGLVNTISNRFLSREWGSMVDVRNNYTALFVFVIILLLAAVIGLLRKKKWGYNLSVTSNSIMAMIPISWFLVSFFWLPSLSAKEILNIHSSNLIVGIISLFFWVTLKYSNIKKVYV